MKIPPSYTEEQVLSVINNISGKLAKKFQFAYYTEEDIRQEIVYAAIKGLEDYDNVRPLENFLYVHVRNRLLNLKRDKFKRPGKPCIKCPYYKSLGDTCTLFEDKVDCELYDSWINRNEAKKNVVLPIDISIINDENEQNTKFYENIDDDLHCREITDIIDKELSVSLREDYLKMRCNVKIPKLRRQKVQEAILEIMQRFGYV